MTECIFCKIITKEIPVDFAYESERVVAFRDINPLAPVHILIIPKQHITTINNLKIQDAELIGEMILAAKQIATDLAIAEKGYRLLFRVGEWGGQEILHIHLHLIGGAKMYEDMHSI